MKIAKFAAFAGCTLLSFVLLADGARCVAQETSPRNKPADGEDSSWYYEPAPQAETQKTIAQQKAIARGQQRMARMAAAKAYGYSPSRPNVTAGSFTTMYSAGWPRGRTFGWFVSQRPVIIVNPTATSYR